MKKLIPLIFLVITNTVFAHSFEMKNTPENLFKENELKINNNSFNIYYENELLKNQNKMIINYIDDFFKNNLNNKKINSLELNLWIYKDSKIKSFSNAQSDCKIDISYPLEEKGFLLMDRKKDIIFILTHELSHCLLGKDIFYNDIHWILEIDEDKKDKIKNIINKKEQLILKDKINKTSLVLPLVIYHEIFADTLASLILLKNNNISLDDVRKIMVVREHTYQQLESKETPYISFLSLKDIIYFIENKKLNLLTMNNDDIFNLALLITQKTFFVYILKLEN